MSWPGVLAPPPLLEVGAGGVAPPIKVLPAGKCGFLHKKLCIFVLMRMILVPEFPPTNALCVNYTLGVET